MSTVRVYDLPTRVFHWSFAALFATAYGVANLVDDESARFAWHMLAGLLLGVAVVLRLLWGLVGSRHARWSDLRLAPRELAGYLKGVVGGGGRLWAGHNPASSWAAAAMLAMALGMVATGIAMATGAPHWVKEVHEVVANLFLAVVLLHLAGLAVHVLRHRDALPRSMVDGRKRGLPDGTAAVPGHAVAGVLVLAVLIGSAVQLARAYDPATRRLDLFGARLVLGENEGAAGTDGAREANGHEDDEARGDD